MGKNSYATVKGQFIQKKMKDGLTNDQARKEWKKSNEKKALKQSGYGYAGDLSKPFFRPSGDEWGDYAWGADDF